MSNSYLNIYYRCDKSCSIMLSLSDKRGQVETLNICGNCPTIKVFQNEEGNMHLSSQGPINLQQMQEILRFSLFLFNQE